MITELRIIAAELSEGDITRESLQFLVDQHQAAIDRGEITYSPDRGRSIINLTALGSLHMIACRRAREKTQKQGSAPGG